MIVKTHLEIPVKIVEKNFVIKGATALRLILGTGSVSGNLHMYNIKKVGNDFIVPISEVKKRKETIELRITTLETTLRTIKQFLKMK